MTTQNFVCILTYRSSQAAYIGQATVEAAGIPCRVTNDDSSTTHPWLGGSSQEVYLQVPATQVQQAIAALDAFEIESRASRFDAWDTERQHGWVCDSCREVNERTFDECWSCQSVRPENPELAPLPVDEDIKPQVEAVANAFETDPEADDSPYRVPLSMSPAAVDLPVDKDLERRILRTAVVGLFIAPFALYSAYLIVRSLSLGRATATVWMSAVFVLFGSVLSPFSLFTVFFTFGL